MVLQRGKCGCFLLINKWRSWVQSALRANRVWQNFCWRVPLHVKLEWAIVEPFVFTFREWNFEFSAPASKRRKCDCKILRPSQTKQFSIKMRFFIQAFFDDTFTTATAIMVSPHARFQAAFCAFLASTILQLTNFSIYYVCIIIVKTVY